MGAGSAGCVIANRLSADPGRQVTLLDSGPSLAPGAVPVGIEGPSFFAAMQEPGRIFPELLATRAAGIEPTVYQRGRGIGGSSAVNAMVALRGSDSLYRSWGWTNVAEAWSRVQIPTELAAMSELGPVDRALLGDDRAEQVQLTRTNGKRVTSAQAYLWPVLERPNLLIRSATAVQRVRFNARRATGVILDDGSELEADHVVLCAGAIHSPVVLLRSGVDTPLVGAGLQDHPSVVFTLVLRDHAHGPETTGLGAVMAALMTPTGRSGSVNIDQAGTPVIDFALLDNPHDVAGLVAAAELTISLLRTRPFDEIAKHVHIDDRGTTVDAISDTASIKRWVLAHCGDYVHATSTCAMGTVVDEGFAVTGYQNLYVCDASVFPSIPDANTHLPTTMVAERFALEHS